MRRCYIVGNYLHKSQSIPDLGTSEGTSPSIKGRWRTSLERAGGLSPSRSRVARAIYIRRAIGPRLRRLLPASHSNGGGSHPPPQPCPLYGSQFSLELEIRALCRSAVSVYVFAILPRYRFLQRKMFGFRPLWRILFAKHVYANDLFGNFDASALGKLCFCNYCSKIKQMCFMPNSMVSMFRVIKEKGKDMEREYGVFTWSRNM